MTAQQKTARTNWRRAKRDYRNARPGERDRTRKALHEAATAVLVADNEAKKRRAA